MENALTNLTDLKRWFEGNANPYFTIYRGSEVKQGNMITKNDNEGDLGKAWIELERSVLSHSKNGSTVFVLCRKKNDNTSVGTSTIFAYNPFTAQMYGGAAIGNMPAQQQPQGLTPSDVAKMIADAKATWERDREIEELKATIGAIQEERQKPYEIANQILGHPSLKPFIAIGSMMLASKMGLDPSLIAQIAGNTEGGHNSDDEHPIEHEDDEIFNEAIENFEGAGFSATEVKKLSIWAKQNKDFAKQIFNSQLSNQMQ